MIVPPIPARFALEGYSAAGTVRTALVNGSPTAGEFGSVGVVDVAAPGSFEGIAPESTPEFVVDVVGVDVDAAPVVLGANS